MQNLTYPTEKEGTLLNFDEAQASAAPNPAPQPEFVSAPRPSVAQHLEVEDKVKQAEEQLALLQERRKRLEQEKEELEKLNERREKFVTGKDEVVQMMTDALPELRVEAEEAQRRSEFLRQMREVFSQHLEVLKTVKPEAWDEAEIDRELERSGVALDDAKAEIERFEERLLGFSTPAAPANKARRAAVADAEFAQWMKMGFAFALPAMIFVAFALVITYLVIAQ